MREENEQSQALRSPFSEVTNPSVPSQQVKINVAQQQSKRREAIMGKPLPVK
jgi:hypothetical protein